MSNTKIKEKGAKGLSAKAVVIPLAIILAILHVVIVYAIVSINRNSALQSSTMQNFSEYVTDATSLQAGTSILSETASTYILMPIAEDGGVNFGSLFTYAAELQRPRRGDDVAERFSGYDVSDEAKERINAAAEASKNMVLMQQKALTLTREVYPIPPLQEFEVIPTVALTAEETEMSPDMKYATAKDLILGTDYANYKKAVSENITACISCLREESAIKSAATLGRISTMRTVLWIVTVLVIVFLITAFIILYGQLISPLGKFVKKITTDDSLDDRMGLYEVRRLSKSYNELLRRRNTLEGVLRTAARTDTLTNLPNRYGFEEVYSSAEKSGGSAAFLIFDVNYLKETNDRQGHIAGDELIKRAAGCISEAFDGSSEGRCFRFGGDEFAVLMTDCREDNVTSAIESFKSSQSKHNVSIACGYAYTDEIKNTNFKELYHEADVRMYENKAELHAAASK